MATIYLPAQPSSSRYHLLSDTSTSHSSISLISSFNTPRPSFYISHYPINLYHVSSTLFLATRAHTLCIYFFLLPATVNSVPNSSSRQVQVPYRKSRCWLLAKSGGGVLQNQTEVGANVLEKRIRFVLLIGRTEIPTPLVMFFNLSYLEA